MNIQASHENKEHNEEIKNNLRDNGGTTINIENREWKIIISDSMTQTLPLTNPSNVIYTENTIYPLSYNTDPQYPILSYNTDPQYPILSYVTCPIIPVEHVEEHKTSVCNNTDTNTDSDIGDMEDQCKD